ncbi:molybdopterin-dependent oxidoreductase [Microbulbifer sp. DLAB2-AF]|uniref:molybdopterin-dependent oxidoreductase n=1 Tax=Microbulbifer sp. DLAB2-AF TaxID=3243395 RepID=UPI0040396517
MSESSLDESRRGFLRAMTAATGALLAPSASVALTPPSTSKLPSGVNPKNFIIHGINPLTIETRRSLMGMSAITPEPRFFVRNNLPLPSPQIVERPDTWMLEVKGVKQPTAISVAELKGLGLDAVGAVIQCTGNGRAFFEHEPAGSKWGVGAAGCAIWTGVRLKTLFDHFGGVDAGMNFLTATGGEIIPEGMERNDLVVERSIPIKKALDDTILAWEMNGAPIPLLHGGPLRLIVPGYFGCNNIKYVKTLTCAPQESEAKIQKTGYRLRPIGAPPGPDYPSMWRMPVKSWVNGPGADNTPALAGEVTFYGVALSGERGVKKVEVSLDMGKTWQDAALEDLDLGPNAWRVFSYTVNLPKGPHTIVSRATDTQGDIQPKERVENERGYAHNGWLDAALTVNLLGELPREKVTATDQHMVKEESPPPERESVSLSAEGQAGKQVYLESQPSCGACHTLKDAGSEGLIGPNLNELKPNAESVKNAVTNGVGAMPAYNDLMTKEQISSLATYIEEATK